MPDLSREALIEKLKALEPQFRAKGVKRLALFGSRARGDNRPDSDVDLLIDAENDTRFSLIDMISVGHVVEDELQLPSSVLMQRDIRSPLLDRVTPDIIRVFE